MAAYGLDRGVMAKLYFDFACALRNPLEFVFSGVPGFSGKIRELMASAHRFPVWRAVRLRSMTCASRVKCLNRRENTVEGRQNKRGVWFI
jgi:hypothetical protein